MKKGWRNFWIVCGIVAGTGVICLAAGKTLGATWSVVGSHFPEWIGFGKNHSAEVYDYGEEAQEADTEQVYENVRSLKVDTEGLYVQILKTDNPEITVKTEDIYSALGFVVTEQNGELELETTARRFPWKLNGSRCGNVWIYLPEEYTLEEAELQTGMGELYVETICADQLKLEVGAGSATVDWFDTDVLDAEVGVGQLEISGNTKQKGELECGVGSLAYTASGDRRDFNYELECGVGELLIGEEEYSGLSVEKKINNGAQKELKISCDVGSTVLSFGEN